MAGKNPLLGLTEALTDALNEAINQLTESPAPEVPTQADIPAEPTPAAVTPEPVIAEAPAVEPVSRRTGSINQKELRRAVILSEIIGPPKSRRR